MRRERGQGPLSQSGKDTVERQPAVNQEEGLHQEPAHAGTLISDLQSPELWEINVCCLSRPVYVTLLQQPKLTTKKNMQYS